MKLGGIVYLYNISQPTMQGSDHQNLAVFQELCGHKALSSVIIGITKSGDIPQEVSEKRCHEISSKYWKKMIEAGASVYPLGNDTTSARNLLTIILQNITSSTTEFVEIQNEVVDQSKLVSETKAAKQLKSTLKEVLEMQKKLALQVENDAERRKEHRDNVNKLDAQINALKVPFSRRLLAAFGLVSALLLKKSLLIFL